LVILIKNDINIIGVNHNNMDILHQPESLNDKVERLTNQGLICKEKCKFDFHSTIQTLKDIKRELLLIIDFHEKYAHDSLVIFCKVLASGLNIENPDEKKLHDNYYEKYYYNDKKLLLKCDYIRREIDPLLFQENSSTKILFVCRNHHKYLQINFLKNLELNMSLQKVDQIN
jgi:hypothetical protein